MLAEFLKLGSGSKNFEDSTTPNNFDIQRYALVYPHNCGGGIPPFLIPSFIHGDPESILIAAAKATQAYAEESLDAEATKVLWTGVYPALLLRLWILTWDYDDDYKGFYNDRSMVPTTNNWAIEKGAGNGRTSG